MLASQKLIDALNAQVGREMGASMQYLAIAAYFDRQTLNELARFFFRQSDEERDHALRFLRFILEAGGEVRLPSIEAPRSKLGSAEECVRLSLEWEKEVTDQIYELVELAKKERNYIALRFLDWFVSEQLEEVSTMDSLLAVVQRAGEDRLLLVEDYLSREKAAMAQPPVGN
jgi:bacterioferritin B